MANTTNFGWETPDDTDLVKDGAAAIRTLGGAIDTSLVDLKGGTTGQILSKTSNTDMDFTWIANDQGDITAVNVTSPITGGGSSGSVTIGIDDGTTAQKGAVQLEDSTSSTSTTKAATPNSVKSAYDLANAAIPKSLIDAEGDLIVGDTADAVQRLAIGTDGQVLTVDTAVDGKIKWASAAGGGKVKQIISATYSTATTIASTSLTDTGLTATITPTSASNKVLVLINSPFVVSRSSTNANSRWAIDRAGTAIFDSGAGSAFVGHSFLNGVTAVELAGNFALQYLDSPATTSSRTYKLQTAVFNTANSGQIITCQGSIPASILLLEVEA